MFCPAVDLPGIIVARSSEISQSDGFVVNTMEGGQNLQQIVIDGAAFPRGEAWSELVVKNAPWHHVHDIEGAAKHIFILAQQIGLGHWYGRWA